MKTTDLDAMQHHSKEFPMEIGAPKFEAVQIKEKKDLAYRTGMLYAQQEYERIMESVRILQKQADDLRTRMGLTEYIRNAIYSFEPVPGKHYWLLEDTRLNIIRLCLLGPNDWSCGPPNQYKYISRVKCLGNSTWEPADQN